MLIPLKEVFVFVIADIGLYLNDLEETCYYYKKCSVPRPSESST